MSDYSFEKYTLGRGQFLFNQKVNGSYTGLYPIGDVNSLTSSVEIESLTHYSSREGLKQLDLDQVISVEPKISFVTENFTAKNFGMNALGTQSQVVQSSATDATAEITSKKFNFFDLGKRDVSNVTIPTYTEGTDFIVYETMGYIFIPADSTIADDTALTVTFDCAAKTYEQVALYTETTIEGKAVFLGANPFGYKPLWEIPKITLKTSGEIALISGDTQLALSFEGSLLSNAAADPSYPYGKIAFL